MALKKVVKKTKGDEKVLELTNEITELDKKIFALQQKREQVQNEILEIQIHPFKVGQTVLAEIPSGRNKKWQKCIIESERGVLYLRPMKEDGELSVRHFSLIPVGDKTYVDYLKEVK